MTLPLSGSDPGLFLTFRLRGRLCALRILDIAEIIEYAAPVGIPAAPDFLAGVLNLRGRSLIVLDPACEFFGGRSVPGKTTCIVILNENPSGSALCGILADSVLDVMTIESASMEASPDISAAHVEMFCSVGQETAFVLRPEMLRGMAQKNVMSSGAASAGGIV